MILFNYDGFDMSFSLPVSDMVSAAQLQLTVQSGCGLVHINLTSSVEKFK